MCDWQLRGTDEINSTCRLAGEPDWNKCECPIGLNDHQMFLSGETSAVYNIHLFTRARVKGVEYSRLKNRTPGIVPLVRVASAKPS